MTELNCLSKQQFYCERNTLANGIVKRLLQDKYLAQDTFTDRKLDFLIGEYVLFIIILKKRNAETPNNLHGRNFSFQFAPIN
jgi:hypothetical protein